MRVNVVCSGAAIFGCPEFVPLATSEVEPPRRNRLVQERLHGAMMAVACQISTEQLVLVNFMPVEGSVGMMHQACEHFLSQSVNTLRVQQRTFFCNHCSNVVCQRERLRTPHFAKQRACEPL